MNRNMRNRIANLRALPDLPDDVQRALSSKEPLLSSGIVIRTDAELLDLITLIVAEASNLARFENIEVLEATLRRLAGEPCEPHQHYICDAMRVMRQAQQEIRVLIERTRAAQDAPAPGEESDDA